MIRSFRYRLYPTRAQERVLLQWLEGARELYNAGLQERRDAWRKQRVGLTEFMQFRELPAVRKARPDIAAIPTVVLRGALSRLDKAFKNFFRRVKAGEIPGYPRFKRRERFASLLLDDFSWLNRRGGKTTPLVVAGGKRIALPVVGKIKLKMHRPIGGTPKGLRITHECGRWHVSFFCVDVPARPREETRNDVGIDLGLASFAATSDGEIFENPRVLEHARIKTERAQRRVTRREIGSKRRTRARRAFARQHARVANLRRENHLRIARSLVATYGTIFVESLSIRGLSRGPLAKSVHDVAWGNFLHWLHVKAEEAGREVVEVNPRNTSKLCSRCGATVDKTLKVRTHCCPSCGLVLDRDVNAALNILSAGRALRRDALLVKGRQ